MNEELDKRLTSTWEVVKKRAADENLNYRQAAYVIAVERIVKAMNMRGF